MDDFVFRDTIDELGAFADRPDLGTMALTIVDRSPKTIAAAQLPNGEAAGVLLDQTERPESETRPIVSADRLVGGIKHQLTLAPGASQTVTFIVSWYFPNVAEPVLPGRIACDSTDGGSDEGWRVCHVA